MRSHRHIMFTELLYSSDMLLRVLVPVSSSLYFSLRKRQRTYFVRCELGLVISSDSSNIRHSLRLRSFMNRARLRFSLPSMEVETIRKMPSGTSSRSLEVRITRYRSLLVFRKASQVMLMAMAGASMTTLRTLRNLSRYLARWYAAAVLPEPCCQLRRAYLFCRTRLRSCFCRWVNWQVS